MTAKIVCRLLDAENNLLGWVEHHAAVRGDGCLRADGPVSLLVDQDGLPAIVSLHWADVNVETRVPCPSVHVRRGQVFAVFTSGEPIVRLGVPPVGLPQVTVGQPVRIGIPVGQLGAVGHL